MKRLTGFKHSNFERVETMKKQNFELSEEFQKGHYGQSYQLSTTFKRKKLEFFIASGLSDDVFCYSEGEHIFVLSKNDRYGYVGLEVFDKLGESVSSVFLQSSEEVQEILGKKGLDYSACFMVKVLSQYCEI